jgi:hypothetical protein
LPLGTERIYKSRYFIRKVQDTGNYLQDWHPVHRLVWQEAGRIIPPGYYIAFKDGNRWNPALENLKLTAMAENFGRSAVDPPELIATIKLIHQLDRLINHV